ncbi:MAG TPA: arylsulfatase [Bacillota bacterium]|nr:arylsulfatase [Bacillota bacterium]
MKCRSVSAWLAGWLGTVLVSLSLAAQAAAPRPNIILILADDLGFSDIGCYGGEIRTPHLDGLAAQGLRFTQFYNVGRCCPSRASLLTGLYPHQAHVGDMVDEYARPAREKLNSPAYSDHLNPHAPTLAEALRMAGYRTGMSGKWHLGYRTNEWPAARGFDSSFAVIEGAMNYYGFGMQHTGVITNPPMVQDRQVFLPPREGFFATDAFTDYAVRFLKESKADARPFFLYLAYTAPHWPLQARPENIARHRHHYQALGWDRLRQERYERLQRAGIIDARWPLAPRPANVRPWNEAAPQRQDQWDQEMSVYAAQVEEMDQGIGRVLEALRQSGRETNTMVLFMSDNGGAAEDPNRSLPGAVLGSRESFRGYGIGGAHVSSSPFRKTKKFTHEGGIAAPLIVRWPAGLAPGLSGKLNHSISHFIDLMPTCLELADASLPKQWNGAPTLPPEGISLAPLFQPGQTLTRSQPLFWEHEGQRAIRSGKWKLVASFNEPWELYDMEADRVELNNLAQAQPEIARKLVGQYETWAERAGVKPWPVMVNAKSETELKKELPAPSGLIRNPKQTTDSVKK